MEHTLHERGALGTVIDEGKQSVEERATELLAADIDISLRRWDALEQLVPYATDTAIQCTARSVEAVLCNVQLARPLRLGQPLALLKDRVKGHPCCGCMLR